MKGFLLLIHRAQKKLRKLKKFLQKLLQKKKQIILFASLPAFLIIVLILIILVENSLKNEIYSKRLLSIGFDIPFQAQYPVIAANISPKISAHSAIVMDDDSKVILFSKNSNQLLPMASTTKIMTALIALENYSLDHILSADDNNISGVTIGLKKGEKLFFKDLLYGMLLPSGNDAAYTLSANYPGGEKEFVAKMNQKAKELQLKNTHFADPIGLSGENYTSAKDLSRLTSIAVKNPVFKSVVGTKNKIITDISGSIEYSLFNLNKLLGQDGVNGVKTGFTDEAGEVLVTSKDDNGHTIIIVVMKSQDRFADTREILSLVKGNITYQSIHP